MKDVVIRLNGGLGNQMFQYAFAKATAREHGARLLVDRSLFDLPYIPERYRLDAFDLGPTFTGPLENLLTRMLLSPKLPKAVRDAALTILSTDIVDEDELSALGATPGTGMGRAGFRRTFFVGYFQRFAAFAHMVDELRRDFHLPLPCAHMRQTLQAIEATESVAVHVRRGDYAKIPLFRDTLGVLSARYYAGALALMRERVANPKFFVFTDDPDWVRRELISESGDVGVVEPNPETTDLTDMALMRACAHFIVANSTFSWWPAFLAERSGKTVVAPKPWFIKDGLGFEARVPASWIALKSDFADGSGETTGATSAQDTVRT